MLTHADAAPGFEEIQTAPRRLGFQMKQTLKYFLPAWLIILLWRMELYLTARNARELLNAGVLVACWGLLLLLSYVRIRMQRWPQMAVRVTQDGIAVGLNDDTQECVIPAREITACSVERRDTVSGPAIFGIRPFSAEDRMWAEVRVAGDTGVVLTLKGNRQVFVGSQRAHELAAAVATITSTHARMVEDEK